MPETLQAPDIRNDIPHPTMYQDLVEPAKSASMRERANNLLDSKLKEPVETNYVTRTDPRIAQEVANSIKPEIDTIVDAQERIENPLARAAMDASGAIIGSEDVGALSLQQKAARVDLERNANIATDIAIQNGIGKVALRRPV